MGTFGVTTRIGDRDRQRWVEAPALVDTGASVTSLPASVLRELEVAVLFRQNFRFAQREVRTMDAGQSWIPVEGREVVTLVLFDDEGTEPLPGAMVLESVFMVGDPVGQRLVPVEGLMI